MTSQLEPRKVLWCNRLNVPCMGPSYCGKRVGDTFCQSEWRDAAEAEPDQRPATTRAKILQEAIQIITRDRNATHGEPEDTFALIAALWSAWLGQTIQPHEVGALMQLFKLARAKGNPGLRDNWVDNLGYGACAAELALEGER